MLGAIVGDIVGSRFEFLNRKSKEFEFFHSNCHVTDDSIMTIAVGEALMAFRENGGDLREHTVASMRKWGRKYINAGYGGKFIEWLLCENPCPYGSCGMARRYVLVCAVGRRKLTPRPWSLLGP